jgi:hypothetical protein
MTDLYFLGALSLADPTVFPHLRLPRRIAGRKPSQGMLNNSLPANLAAWNKQIEGLPYYEKAIPSHWKG